MFLFSTRAKALVAGQIRLTSLSYQSEQAADPVDSTSFQELDLQLLLKNQRGAHEYSLDGRFGFFLADESSFSSVRELYYGFSWQDHLSFKLGRRLFAWNKDEAFWLSSLWQPYYNIDPLNPDYQGLSGFFVDWSRGDWSSTFFGSPIFAPNMNPEVKESEGQLNSSNPWFQSPSRDFSLAGRSTQILYNLDIPELKKIVMQNSFAFSLAWRKSDLWLNPDGPYASLQAAEKPNNELLFYYRGILKIRDDGTFGDVTIRPEVAKHRLLTLSAGYNLLPFSLRFTHTQDEVDNKLPPEGSNTQKLFPVRLSTLAFEYVWGAGYADVKHTLNLGLFYLQGGETQEIDSSGEISGSLFPPRLKFKEAFKVDYRGPLWLWHKNKISLNTHWLYDRYYRASLFGAEVDWSIKQKMRLFLGADILGVENEAEPASHFISAFRSNDRVYFGASYEL